ncbi:MAG: hypothetical protein ACLUMN_00175 [Oscillospiraceae bacterium]
MADDSKAVGPRATAKLVALIKAETAKKYDKTGGKIDGNAEITGGLKVGMSSEFSSSIKAGSEISSDMLLMAPIVELRDPAKEESIYFGVSGESSAKVTSPVSGGGTQYARLAVGTPTGDNDATTKAYVDGRTHDYYDVTVISAAGAVQTIDGGIISVRGSADKTVAEIAAAYAAGAIVRCIYGGNIMPLVRAEDGGYSFAGTGANYGVARDGNITVTIMPTSSGDVTWITSAAGELPIPDSDVSQNGCALVVRDGQWMYSEDKLIPATPTSNGLMSAADKAKLDSMDSVCYDIYAKIGTADTHDSVYKYGCMVSHTFAEINAAVHAGKTPRVLLVDNIDNPSDTRVICPLSEYDTSRSEGGYYFDAPGLVGVSGSGRIYIDENGAMYTCSAGELPAVDENQDGKYLTIDGGRWTYRQPDTATATAPGFMSTADKAKLDGIERGANKTVVDAALDAASTNPVQNKAVKTALDGKAGTAVATQSSAGLMSSDDKTKLDGVEAGANKTIVDAALDEASENPVQNKAVKAALDSKLSTRGGEISASLEVGQTVSAEGSVSVGRTSTDTGIHFEKAASDAGRISHGSDPMTGVAPIARLKVADPTEDDDATTKAYVDGSAVRYDAAQALDEAQKNQARENVGAASAFAPILTSPVMIRKWGETESAGVYLSTVGIGEKHAEIRLEDVNENSPVAIANLRTPTDAQTDYATNVAYVKAKVAEVAASGGVDVDNALSATSTNPVQNKVITSALAKKAGTAVATESANGLMSAADKKKLDGIADGANKTVVDAALDAGSANPVQNKAVKAALDNKSDKTALDAKADKTALNAKLDKTGGTLTGNLTGKYITGTWLQSTAASDLGRTPDKIAVLDGSGWVYYRTPAELVADLGIANAIKSYVDTAIAVAINSAY